MTVATLNLEGLRYVWQCSWRALYNHCGMAFAVFVLATTPLFWVALHVAIVRFTSHSPHSTRRCIVRDKFSTQHPQVYCERQLRALAKLSHSTLRCIVKRDVVIILHMYIYIVVV